MRSLGLIFAGLTAFLAGAGALYWFTAYEPAGTALLVGATLTIGIMAAYLTVVARRHGVPLNDRLDARPTDAVGEELRFPAPSIWPFVAGVAAFSVALGLVFNGWVALPGIVLFVAALFGMSRMGPPGP